MWKINFIHEINGFLDPSLHFITTGPWKSWALRRKDKSAFHDKIDGVEVRLFFDNKILFVNIDVHKDGAFVFKEEEFDYQDPNEFDAEKIAAFICDTIS